MKAEELPAVERRRLVFVVRSPGFPDAVVKWDPNGAGGRFLHEWAALRFLSDLGMQPPLSPRFLGADREAAVLIMERLQPAPSLAELLLDTNLTAAVAGLRGLGRALGRLHAYSMRHIRHYRILRAALAVPTGPEHQMLPIARCGAALTQIQDEFGLPCKDHFLRKELDKIEDKLGALSVTALLHGDVCPDNAKVYEQRTMLLDFEHSGIASPMIDATCPRLRFPTCWCVGAIDPDVMNAVEDGYRAEVRAEWPAVADDAFWMNEVAHAAAAWFLSVITRFADEALKDDGTWGTASIRQRIIDQARQFSSAARAAQALPALSDFAIELASAMSRRWPQASSLPPFPPFAKGGPVVDGPSWWRAEQCGDRST